MCAQFMIRASAKNIATQTGLKIEDIDPNYDWNFRVLPYGKAPVIVKDAKKTTIKEYQFSLLPRWSKEKKVKFATHNARLESVDEKSKKKTLIFEKPTWRDAFSKRHCLIPLTTFIEPIYSGKLAGNMVKFTQPEETLLIAAGIWEEWVGKDGEVIDSFTIITDDPIPFVKKTGHDRSPLFLQEDAFEQWLLAEQHKPQEWFEFLREYKFLPKLVAEKDRALKAGWEKRS